MKKIYLLLTLICSMAKGQTTLKIDSIKPGTITSTITGIYINSPSYVNLGTYVKVYMHSTGSWSPTYPLSLKFNGNTVKSGTYQNLSDSGFVWGFTIPTCDNFSDTFYGVSIYNSTVNYQVHKCTSTEINEHEPEVKVIKTEYYNILGQPSKEGDVIIKIEYLENNTVRRSKTITN